ncbi:hypothetical protein [Parabacteroides distasonis]|uniref:hypothetical protein n=1 Tax=Parabacteroides distasonis TaxID=823 RepID=UPI001899DACA|nr:hypothetical protein [Parabacteroides distasonis]
MNVSEAEFEYIKEGIAKDMVILLVKEHGMQITDALDALYTSDTFCKLSDPRTKLYIQSPRYVLQFLLSELERGKIEE